MATVESVAGPIDQETRWRLTEALDEAADAVKHLGSAAADSLNVRQWSRVITAEKHLKAAMRIIEAERRRLKRRSNGD